MAHLELCLGKHRQQGTLSALKLPHAADASQLHIQIKPGLRPKDWASGQHSALPHRSLQGAHSMHLLGPLPASGSAEVVAMLVVLRAMLCGSSSLHRACLQSLSSWDGGAIGDKLSVCHMIWT